MEVKNTNMSETKLKWQREHRIKTNNLDTKKYEKTHKGFLMRLYRNMQSRILGIQKQKNHLYKDKELLERHEFYTWAITHPTFISLFEKYKENNFDRKLAPSVDRIDSNKGYILSNMEWVTHSENSRRGNINTLRIRWNKSTYNGKVTVSNNLDNDK